MRETPGSLWWEGFRCGLINLAHFPQNSELVHAARLLLCPVDLWRYHEFAAALDAWRTIRAKRILDVGSPKLLALYLARRHGVSVLATDISERIGPECSVLARAVPSARTPLIPQVLDATAMPFVSGSFPFIYSISAIEHIAGDGDTRAASEIGRLLSPGGKAVITVPLVPESRELWVDGDPYGRQHRGEDGRVFFARLYDWDSLKKRVIEPSGLRLTRVQCWQERQDGWYARYVRRTTPSRSVHAAAVRLLDWYWSFHRLELVETVTRHGVAALTLEKT